MEIDNDYLRTGTAIGFRASRELCSNYLSQPSARHQFTLRDHEYGTSVSLCIPFFVSDFASTHRVYPRRDGQAELTWVTCLLTHLSTNLAHARQNNFVDVTKNAAANEAANGQSHQNSALKICCDAAILACNENISATFLLDMQRRFQLITRSLGQSLAVYQLPVGTFYACKLLRPPSSPHHYQRHYQHQQQQQHHQSLGLITRQPYCTLLVKQTDSALSVVHGCQRLLQPRTKNAE